MLQPRHRPPSDAMSAPLLDERTLGGSSPVAQLSVSHCDDDTRLRSYRRTRSFWTSISQTLPPLPPLATWAWGTTDSEAAPKRRSAMAAAAAGRLVSGRAR